MTQREKDNVRREFAARCKRLETRNPTEAVSSRHSSRSVGAQIHGDRTAQIAMLTRTDGPQPRESLLPLTCAALRQLPRRLCLSATLSPKRRGGCCALKRKSSFDVDGPQVQESRQLRQAVSGHLREFQNASTPNCSIRWLRTCSTMETIRPPFFRTPNDRAYVSPPMLSKTAS